MSIFGKLNVIFICAFIKSKTKETYINSRFSQTVALDLFNLKILKILLLISGDFSRQQNYITKISPVKSF